MKTNYIPGAAALALVAYLLSFCATSAGVVKLAESGDAEPGGTNVFFQINQFPTLNDLGQVAFNTDLRNDGFLQGFGIYLADGSTVKTIAHAPQPAPDLDGNFYSFYQTVALNATSAAFQATLNGTLGNSEDKYGLYQLTGSSLVQLARGGQATPDGSGNFLSLQGISVRINRGGQTAFTCPTSSNQWVVYRSTGGNLRRMAYYKQPIPDGSGTLGNLIADASLNNKGQVAFYATLVSTSLMGYLLADDNGLKILAIGKQAAPDGNGSILTFQSTMAPLNDSGQIAFAAMLSGTSGGSVDNQAVYRTDGTALEQIARKGQLVPGGNGRVLDFGQNMIALNNSGEVAFLANLTGTTGGSADNAAIYVSQGGTIQQVLRKGQMAPDGNGTFAGFGNPALNNKGEIAVRATLTGTTGGANDNIGIYFVDAQGRVQQVIRAGERIDGETVSNPMFLDGPNYGGLSGLNDESEIAFSAYLNGNSGIFLWNQFVITGVARVGNDVRVSWDAVNDSTNYVQAASTAAGPFSDISGAIINGHGVMTTNFVDPGGATNPTRLYRIRLAR